MKPIYQSEAVKDQLMSHINAGMTREKENNLALVNFALQHERVLNHESRTMEVKARDTSWKALLACLYRVVLGHPEHEMSKAAYRKALIDWHNENAPEDWPRAK